MTLEEESPVRESRNYDKWKNCYEERRYDALGPLEFLQDSASYLAANGFQRVNVVGPLISFTGVFSKSFGATPNLNYITITESGLVILECPKDTVSDRGYYSANSFLPIGLTGSRKAIDEVVAGLPANVKLKSSRYY